MKLTFNIVSFKKLIQSFQHNAIDTCKVDLSVFIMIALFYKVILSKSLKTVYFTKINKYMYIYTCLFPPMLCKYIKGKENVPQAKKTPIGEYRNMRYSF